MRKRNISIRVRLTEAEYADLTAKVQESGLNRNAFMLRLIAAETIYPASELQGLNERLDSLLAQIRGMATNLNQMTKVANARQEAPTVEYLKSLAKAMSQFATAIQPVWTDIRGVLYGDS